MFHNHLIYRLLISNACAGAGLIWAWSQGYLDYMASDTSRISYAILALFGIGMVSLFIRAIKVSWALNAIKAGGRLDINEVKFTAKGNHIQFIAYACQALGFFGTVVGLIYLLHGGGGLTTDGSLDSVKRILDQILVGGGIAFMTTAVGLITSLWLEWNYSTLQTATSCMLEDGRHA